MMTALEAHVHRCTGLISIKLRLEQHHAADPDGRAALKEIEAAIAAFDRAMKSLEKIDY
jgi:hypothetical protein